MSFIQQTFNLFKSFYPNVISQNSQVWSTHSCSLIKTVLMLTLVVSHAVSVPTSAPFIPNDIEKADNEPQSKNDINYAPLFMSRKLLQCSVTAPFPGHSSTYSGNVRGYYFQAPTNFAITSIFIPTDASTGSSTAAVVRFNSVAPPEYSATTNDFTQLGYWVQSAASTISTNCICVSSGQYIGIIGYRGTSNSYGNAPYTSSINGYSVVFRRMGMQNSLITSAPHNLFGQADGDSLSRVHFTYTICDSTCNCPGITSAPTSVAPTSVAPTSAAPTSTPTTSESICDFKFYSYPDHEFAEQSGYTLMTYNRLQDSNPFPYKAHFINFLQANNGNIQALAQFSTAYSSITYGAKIGYQGYDCMGVTNYDWTYFHTDVPTGGVYWVDINYSIYFGSSRAKKTSWSTSDVFTKQGLVSC
eukprot:74694_1